MPRATSHSMTGLSPMARNNATTMRTMTLRASDDRLDEEVRDEDAEGAEEAEHERRVAADRPPEPAERRVLAVGAGLELALAGGRGGRPGVLVRDDRLVAGVLGLVPGRRCLVPGQLGLVEGDLDRRPVSGTGR